MGLTETCIKCGTSIDNFQENEVYGDIYEQVSSNCKICHIKQKITDEDGIRKYYVWGTKNKIYKSFRKDPSLLSKVQRKLGGVSWEFEISIPIHPINLNLRLKNKKEEEDEEWVLVATKRTNRVGYA
jgi:hypothetical protein